MKLNYGLILTLLFFCLAQTGSAWNERGHMFIASAAYQQLSKKKQHQITELLKEHPDYATIWAKDYEALKNHITPGEYLMMRAAIWPDEIRSSTHPDHSYHRAEWHYITYKISFTRGCDTSAIDGNKQPNVVWAIEYARQQISNNQTDRATKAIYMCWLIHLIGDVHQPLHCGSLFNEVYPDGDKGGNKFFIRADGNVQNLHALWDDALGKGGKGDETDIHRMILESLTERKSVLKKYDIKTYAPRPWSLESLRYAVRVAHLNGALQGSATKEEAPDLPEGYISSMRLLSELRCLLAGKRLGSVINKLQLL